MDFGGRLDLGAIRRRRGGTPTPTPSPTYATYPGASGTLSAPSFQYTTDAVTYPIDIFTPTYSTWQAARTIITIQIATDARMGNLVYQWRGTINDADVADGDVAAAFSSLLAASGPYYIQGWAEKGDSTSDPTGIAVSALSPVLIYGAVADTVPTDDTLGAVTGADAANPRVYTSAWFKPLGFNSPTTITAEIEYQTSLDGITANGGWQSSAGTFYPGDYVRSRVTSSGSGSTTTTNNVTIGGVVFEYSAQTVLVVPALPTTNLVASWEADDLTTLFNTITGTGAISDGVLLGTFNDRSGHSKNLTAPGNTATRPTWRQNGSFPRIEFNATNSTFLRMLSNLIGTGLYNEAGGFTFAIAMKTVAATQSASNFAPFGEGSGSSNSPIHAPASSVTGTAQVNFFIRDDGAVAVTPGTSSTMDTDAFDGNDTVLIFTYDPGTSTLTCYEDSSTVGTTKTYTRRTLTLNQFGFGGFPRGSTGTGSGYMSYYLYAAAAWNDQKGSTDRATILTRLAAKQGRAL